MTVPSDRKEARGSCLICGYDRPYRVWHESEVAGVCEDCYLTVTREAGLLAVVERYENALRQIGEQQQKTLGWIRDWDIVFDEAPGKNPGNWQHVAFSIYTDLCEVDSWARSALAGTEEPTCDCGGNHSALVGDSTLGAGHSVRCPVRIAYPYVAGTEEST